MDAFTQQTKVLRAIKDAGQNGIENYKLSRIALKYTSVISELRQDGYNIVAERDLLKNGRPSNTWRYRLLSGEPTPRTKKYKGNEVVRELMIAKSKGRFACYKYISDRLLELGV